MSEYEGHWLYVYDDAWRPRWAFAETSDVNASTSGELLQFQGFCPSCPTLPPTLQPIGIIQRSYDDSGAGTLSLDMDFAAPLGGSWNQDQPMARVSAALICFGE